MPLTTTATMVDIPASVRTGSGRFEPEPWPNLMSGNVSIQCNVQERV